MSDESSALSHAHASLARAVTWTVGGLLGGLAGAFTAVLLTELIKASLAVASGLGAAWLLGLPLVGVALAAQVLFGLGKGQPVQTLAPQEATAAIPWRSLTAWYSFPHDIARADLTGDVVNVSGNEERFPWNLAPLRALAILATVGLGAPMGTESPAAHIGVATGAWLGALHASLRPMARAMAIGGGAAGVSALMGLPLVGSCFMFELGKRRQVPLTLERLAAMVAGGLWAAAKASLLIGVTAGALTALTGEAIYWARGLRHRSVRRFLVGATAMAALALLIGHLATPAAAFGPGGSAIIWAETTPSTPGRLMLVALLRAAATTAAVLAGGCGGVFVPFLAIGDLTGRVFATPFAIAGDLAGAAGAAAAIAGGYRLPLTAIAMATVLVAAFTGWVAARLANAITTSLRTVLP